MFRIEDSASAETLVMLNQCVHTWHVDAFPDMFKDNAEDGLLQYFKTSIENPNCFHYVAYDGTIPIGFTQAEIRTHNGSPFRHPQKLCYVNIIAVLPERRNNGVGKKLIQSIFALAKAHKIDRVELDHWEGNEAAMFFTRMGFHPYRHYMAAKLDKN